MRMYVDRFTDRGRTQLVLMVADFIGIAVTITYAAGAWSRPERWIDGVCLGVWAAVPRLLAPYIRWMRRTRPFGETLIYVIGLVLLSVVLFFGGIDLVWSGLPPEQQPPLHSVLLIFALWASTFFLFHPPWYRVNDIAMAGVMLMGLLERQPHPVVASVLFFGSCVISAAVRNLLHNVYLDVRRPLINLQNARTAAVIMGAGGTVSFTVLFFFFSYWVPFDVPGRSVGRDPSSDSVADRLERDDDQALSSAGSSGRPNGGDFGNGAAGRDGGGSSGGNSGGSGAARERSSTDERVLQVGITGSVQLTDLGNVSENDQIAVRIRVPSINDRARWGLDAKTLFRVSSAVIPDESGENWSPVLDDKVRTWSAETIIRGEAYGAPDLVLAEIQILIPSIRFLLSPYRLAQYGPVDRTRQYHRTDSGDIVLTPSLAPGDRYVVRFRPIAFDRRMINARTRVATARHRDPATLQLPADPGFDVERLASEIFRGEVSIGGKIRALRRYFQRHDFKYALTTQWRADQDRLARFLLVERAGDCNYFSIASAVLLRAGGVSTRLATGFTGAELDVNTGDYLLYQRTAHAWTEYYLPSVGWVPIDPTTWVPTLESEPGEGSSGVAAVGTDGSNGNGGTGTDSSGAPTDPRDPRLAQGSEPQPGSSLSGGGFDDDSPLTSDSGGRDTLAGRSSESGSRSGETGESGTWPDDLDHPTAFPGDAGNSSSQPVDPVESARRRQSFASAIARLALLLFAGILVSVTVRRLLSPKSTELEDEVPADEATVSNPLGGVALAPPDYEPVDENESVVFHYQSLQYTLSRTRCNRHPHETPAQHARRFSGQSDVLDDAFASLNSRLYALLYASRAMNADDVVTVEESCRVIRRELTR